MMGREGVVIEVGIADARVSSSPDILITRGLGSCVGITFYDPTKKIGGLVHPMLPDMNSIKVPSKPQKFVNAAMILMIEELKKRGCALFNLEVKLFGGAHMFSSVPETGPFNIGAKNVAKAKEICEMLGLKVMGEDTGGNFGRTIEIDLSTGKVKIKTLFHGEKEI